MVVLGFTIAFPEWLELKDLIIAERVTTKSNRSKEIPKSINTRMPNEHSSPFPDDFFPDSNFRKCLNKQRKQPNMIFNLSCNNKSIKNLIGINRLVNLKYLDVSNNELDFISLSPTQQLIELDISHNKIIKLDIEGVNLEKLNISHNQLFTIDLGLTPKLKVLKSRNNELRFISLNAPELTILDASYNQIESIDLTQSKKIRSLILSNNNLSEFNFDQIEKLKLIDLRNNKIKKFLNTFNDSSFTMFINNNTYFTSKAAYKFIFPKAKVINQELSYTDFPDPIFRDCIAMNQMNQKVSFDQLKSIQCRANMGLIHENKKIKNLKGIENFINLERITISNHDIQSIDLEPFKNLYLAELEGNKIKSIKVANKNLRNLYLKGNKIDSLNLEYAPNIRTLMLQNNELKDLNISKLEKLRVLDVSSNQLKKIQLAQAPYIESIQLNNNPWNEESFAYFRSRFWPNMTSVVNQKILNQRPLIRIYAADPTLFPGYYLRRCITKHVNDEKINSYTEIIALRCQGKVIKSSKGLELLSQLKYLSLKLTQIEELNLIQFKNLESLSLSKNKIKKLDLTGTTNLRLLSVENSTLNEILFDSSHDLGYLNVSNNNLTELNLHSMPTLTKLFANNNQLQSFKIGNAVKLTHLILSNNFLNEVKYGKTTSLKYLDLANNSIIEVPLSDMPKLESLDISNNRFNSLNFEDAILLKSLSIFGNESMQPQISDTQLDNIRVDLAQFQYLENTGQLEFFEYVEKYKLDRYFLKRNLNSTTMD